jgi:CBS domain containing-hemolysin-like protein
LESLFVWYFTEGVVGVVALEDWVETAVGGVKAEADHVSPERSVAKRSFNQGKVAAI